MPEVLTAPQVMTGDQTLPHGAVVIGDNTVDWVGLAGELPAEFTGLPRTDYPGCTITPGLIDCHVHLGFDGGPQPAARMRGATDAQHPSGLRRDARALLAAAGRPARAVA